MKKIITFIVLVSFAKIGYAQEKMSVIKTSKETIDIRIGTKLNKNEWTLSPETNPDIYEAKLPDGKSQKVTFITDVDSISFDVKLGKKYNFIIKKNESICNTQIIGVYDSIEKYKKYTDKQLYQDFDILKNAYIETKVGLWYNTRTQFDSICNVQRSKIKDGMHPLEFYQILAPITAFTKEGHSVIRPSKATMGYLEKRKLLPFFVKIFNKKAYIINNVKGFETKGLEIVSINGNTIDSILKVFTSIEPSDGYNFTSKYRWVENSFSKYYSLFFETYPKYFSVELKDPKTHKNIQYQIPNINYESYTKNYDDFLVELPTYEYKDNYTFTLDLNNKTAILTFNSFLLWPLEKEKEFDTFLETSFKAIADNHIENVIIDVRKNEGGNQGVEDKVMAYLIDKKYKKYQYVEIPSFDYSFVSMTNYKNEADRLKKQLNEEFEHKNDGRYLLKAGLMEGLEPAKNNFKGNIYILISGLTFSGGSEFAALAKNYTRAKFIGEETGGGYYGNSSGQNLKFTLPNTKLTGQIPLHKYVLETPNTTVPYGHGVLPDYTVQPTIDEYLNGYDAELEFTKKLILKK